MKYTNVPIYATLLLLASCASVNENSINSAPTTLTPGRTIETEITNSSPYRTFSFYSGDRSQYALKISSYLPMGGLGALFNGSPVVYPAIVLKDKSGNIVASHFVARYAVPPGWVNSLHLESDWSLNLKPRHYYTLTVMANPNANSESAEFRTMASTTPGPVIMPGFHVKPTLSNVKTGKLEIQLH